MSHDPATTRDIERLTLLGLDATSSECSIRWVSRPGWYEVRLLADGVDLTGTGLDLFAALRVVRSELDARALKLLCNGARADVHPSGMARSMSGARLVYVLELGRPAGQEDLVPIFGQAPAEAVDTVQAQDVFFGRWLESLGLPKLQAERGDDFVRRRHDLYVGPEGFSETRAVELIQEQAAKAGVEVEIDTAGEWWLLGANSDWLLRAGPAVEAFHQLGFPEVGQNAVRQEAVLTAFARTVLTSHDGKAFVVVDRAGEAEYGQAAFRAWFSRWNRTVVFLP
jgi:hypothetical protein